ncbi:hypothetical protein D9758_015740 [Tetrapyrgos nigripes]|uniref:HAT C-terminal dimerisation domain-containing protein n=1 Tax=Tetrapyrgos nigripes TaxID=182062 RepID=A0A8H5CRQ8_9AGAR|nr:hypothetical protein D9758_015740 [Tetrapyrgos nigripes]
MSSDISGFWIYQSLQKAGVEIKPSSGPSSLQDELDEYFQITSSCAKMSINPLEWWYARREQFPHLYRFAHDVLCIPGSAVAVDLKADTIQALMVVKAQLRMARIAIIEILGDE